MQEIVQPRVSHSDLLLAREAQCVVLLTSVGEEGLPVYAFLKLRGDRIATLREAMAQEFFSPSQFGDILASGPGPVPHAVMQRMAREYGYNAEAAVPLPKVA